MTTETIEGPMRGFWIKTPTKYINVALVREVAWSTHPETKPSPNAHLNLVGMSRTVHAGRHSGVISLDGKMLIEIPPCDNCDDVVKRYLQEFEAHLVSGTIWDLSGDPLVK